MSEFDNFFRDKLDEEQSFPRRNKNWNMVSKRLDAFDAGGISQHPVLKYWKVLTMAAAVTVGVLSWKLVSVQQENAQLRLEISRQQSETGSKKSEVGSAKSTNSSLKSGVTHPSASETTTYDTENTAAAPQQQQERNSAQPVSKSIARHSELEKQPEKKQPATKTFPEIAKSPATRPFPSKRESAPISEKTAGSETAVPATATTPNVAAQPEAQVAPPLAEQLKTDPVTNPITALEGKDSVAQAPATPSVRDTQQIRALDSMAVKPPVAEKPVAALQPDTAAMAAQPELLIKPARSYSRLRAGAEILGGFAVPAETGVSMLKGQGITAAWRFWNNFSLNAGAEWLRFDVCTMKFVPRFHPHHPGPEPHGGQNHDDELVLVESTQRQRQLSLGLNYTVPLHFWIKPSIQVAHTWVRIEPNLITYKFEEPPHGPGGPMQEPEIRYQVEKTELQRLNQIWRVGVGLQHETPRWIFNVGADYLKDFASSNAMFNSVFVKAGLQYKIL
jgi:hypothetical protein